MDSLLVQFDFTMSYIIKYFKLRNFILILHYKLYKPHMKHYLAKLSIMLYLEKGLSR